MDFTSSSSTTCEFTIFNSTDNLFESYTKSYEGSKTVPIPAEPTSLIFQYLKAIAIFLSIYFTPAITVAGTIGNVLSVVVFLRTKLKKLSSSYYLAFLAIFDTGFLWCYFIEWLNFFDIDLYKRNGFCQLFTWLSNTCSVLSVWLVVAFTIERFVAVLYPLKRQSMYTVRRARCIVFYLVLFHAINSSPLLFLAISKKAAKSDRDECMINESYQDVMKFYNYYDFFVAFFIPLTLIITLNTVTAFAVWKPTKFGSTVKSSNREKSVSFRGSTKRDHAINEIPRPCHRQSSAEMEMLERNLKITQCKLLNRHHSIRQSCLETHRQRISNATQMKVTNMLLVISTVFVILNLPSYVVRAWIYIVSANNSDHWCIVIQHYAQTLYLCNFGINFALYCLSGQNFRKELKSLFKSRTMPRSNGTQVTGTGTDR